MSGFFSKTQLVKERGWTWPLIWKYLREPDRTLPNPHSKNRPIRLYLKSRVKKAEDSIEYQVDVAELEAERLGTSSAELDKAAMDATMQWLYPERPGPWS
jgi:hypothetical protein